MAKININTPITAIDGQPLPEPLTFASAVVNGLLAADSTALSVDEKIQRFQLAKKIQQAAVNAGDGSGEYEVDLTLDERAVIKKVCGAVYTPLVIGQLVAMLEG